MSEADVPDSPPTEGPSAPPTSKPSFKQRVGRAFRLAGGLLFLLILLGLAGLYLWLGTVQILPGEQAIVLRLGRYVRTLNAGPHVYFPGVETLERAWVKNQRMEFGYRTRAPSEKAADPTSESEVDPLEYEDDPNERRMLTGDANLVDVEFVLEYDIVDLRTFRLSVRDARGTIRDVARAAVREAVAQRTVDAVLREARGLVQADAEKRIEELLRAYTPRLDGEASSALGIRVLSLRLQDVYPPEPVREAFRDVTSALQDKERLQLEAQTYRDEVVPRARGEAQRLVAEAQAYRDSKVLQAKGEASRFTSLLGEYRKSPEVTRARLYIETLETVLPRADKIIMQDGSGERVMPYLPLGRRTQER